MSIQAKQLIAPQMLTSSAATYYTATRVTARIDAFTVTNTDTAAHSLTVHIVPSGGSAAASNRVIDAKSIHPKETYTCPEMIGKIIPSGSFIQALDDAGSVMSINAAGIEIT